MSRSMITLLGILFGLMIVCVTTLIFAGRDASILVTFLVSTIVPTVAALYAGGQATKAKDAADQTVVNTNGNLNRLINIIESHGISVTEGSADDEASTDRQ